ncbi:MAG: N-acetylmuramoyl-L-alanine amidase, partial [Bacteroidota bacterium]|nr:N-acetylmuramoyl-L-alanine amidase [Bacteroidota bacterium]
MLPIVYYFLQVILCSGIMMGYYWLVLRNKRFHQYNRFYLLGVALLSWIVPLIKISWGHATADNDPQMIRFLSVVADNNSEIESSFIHKGFMVNWTMLASILYITVSLLLLAGMIRAFVRIYQLLKVHSCKSMGDIYLILTQAKGTPFSFFRYIFWNEEIDIRSEAGKQIMAHELTHVRQKHSFDKIFMQVVLIIGWLNPFFWLMKKEMEMIHEFIADHKAVENGDAATLAQMILSAAYPRQQFAMTHPFFFSPIKRRLRMLSNQHRPQFSYLRRLVVLPLLAVVVVLFAFRKKEDRMNATISVGSVVQNVVSDVIRVGDENNPHAISVFNEARLDRNYTVLIDAGHGGSDKGVIGEDGTDESVLNLQLANQIAALNQNKNIRIVLTRSGDINQDWTAKENLISQKEPDLILSLHVGSSSPLQVLSGMELFIPGDLHADNYKGSVALANYLSKNLQPFQGTLPAIKRRTLKDIKILSEVNVPSVLLSTGFINNPDERDRLKNPQYQQQLALSVLQGINDYLSKPAQTRLNLQRMGMDTIILKKEGSENVIKLNYTPEKSDLGKALIVLDGNVINEEIMH